MLEPVLWGLVQGLTEFLPISSSGHLVLIPELLGVDAPDLATTAVLHLGTLTAVVVYYRGELVWLAHFRSDTDARRVLTLLVIATLPAIAVLAVEGLIEDVQASAVAVAWLLVMNGGILFISGFLRTGSRSLEGGKPWDAIAVGVAQVLAVFPGLSRSGLTITAGQARGFQGTQAARFSFLLSIPVILAAAIIEGAELAGEGGLAVDVLIAVAVAALAGYAAIAIVLRVVNRYGLRPFAYYCFALAAVALIAL
ncbi:MAG: undecaprenyl-diphosphate phosphatase [Acidimicrobiia bacterium]